MALRARPYGGPGAQFIIGIALTMVPCFFFMIDEHQLKYVFDGQWNAPIVVT